MKFYLIDDDKTIINILKLIIKNRNLGTVIGTCTHAEDALDDLPQLQPDIVIVDLLMPKMDGITFVQHAKKLVPNTAFIMLSQVSSKDMIAGAYESGIEFYIQKPINSIEVETVIKNVCQNMSMQRTLHKMHSIFTDEIPGTLAPPELTAKQTGRDYQPKLQRILQQLGIAGDNGSKDIVTLAEYLIEQGAEVEDTTLHDLCRRFTDSPKSMEQRIRRAANTGMVNLAHLGLEDYGNEIFNEYANSLYNFEQVRKEMDYIRGKADKHGNIKIKNFLNALIISSQE